MIGDPVHRAAAEAEPADPRQAGAAKSFGVAASATSFLIRVALALMLDFFAR